MTSYTPTAGLSATQFDLLGGGAELVDLSLLASRTAAVLEQISAGNLPSTSDQASLSSMAQFCSEAAHAVAYFGSGGREGSPPRGALAATQVDVAFDAIANERHQADPDAITTRLLEMSARLQASEQPWRTAEADELGAFFSRLARSVLSQTGHVGEVTASY